MPGRREPPNSTDGSARSPGGELRQDRYVGGLDLTHWGSPIGQGIVRLVHRISARFGAYPTVGVILLVGGGIAAALTAVFAAVYDSVTEQDGLAAFDRPVLDAAMQARTPFLDAAVTAYTNLAGGVVMPIWAAVVAVLLCVVRRSWTPLLLTAIAAAGSLAMTVAGKDIVGRGRPDLIDAVPPYEYSPSFPSGHTLNATVIAGVLAYVLILRRRSVIARLGIVAGAAFFAVTIGLSRVFLGHHWLTDVVAGWALGIAWLAFVITAHRLYLTVRRRGDPRAPEPRASGSAQAVP